MEWIEALIDELEGETIDFRTPATILQGLFQNSIYPSLLIDSQGRLGLPHLMSVRVGGSKAVSSLLSHPKVFLNLPVVLQKIVLDVLIFLFARKPYNIVRLQYLDDFYSTTRETCSMTRHLLKLFEESLEKDDLSVSKRLLLLIGFSASIGISVHELRKFLSFLKIPSELSLSLVQTLQLMLQPDDGVTKACPPSIFNFSGPGSGIIINKIAFPFPKEYQVCCWFRLESFEEDFPNESSASRAFNTDDNRIQHIITWTNSSRKGLDIYIEKSQLMVAVSHTSKVEPIIMKVANGGLKKGVWYHLSFRHSKPKMTFFSKDEFEVYLDDELLISESIRFPSLSGNVDVDIIIGHNFDGQMGPIYIFNEVVPLSVIQSIARIDAGRGELFSMDPTDADLSRVIMGPDRRPYSVASKLTTCFHPTRCSNGRCIDIYMGYHGYLGKRTFPWCFNNPRDALTSIGGVLCLLPLFPRLLIENENIEKYSSMYDPMWGIGLGTCLADLLDEDAQLDVYDKQTWLRVNSWKEDFYGFGAISCLLSVVRNAIYNSRSFQEQLLVSGGIDMIQSALQCVSQPLIIDEGEKCVFALIHLKEAAIFSEPLQLKVAKLLLSNTSLWASSGSYQFLNSLLSVVLALIKAEPTASAAIVEFQNLLDTMGLFENLKEENMVRSRINSVASFSGNNSVPASPLIRPDVKEVSSRSYPPMTAKDDAAIAEITMQTQIETPPSEFSPRLHQPLSVSGSEAGSVHSRFSNVNSPAVRAPKRTSNPNQALIASLRKMKSFKLALSETLQDELEDDKSSPKPAGSDDDNIENDEDPTGLEGIQEGDEDCDEEDGTESGIKRQFSTSTVATRKSLSLVTPFASLSIDDVTFDSIMSPYSALEKRKLREYIGCVLAMLLKNNPDEDNVVHIVDFMVTCKDAVVLVELMLVLIYLMDQRCSAFVTSSIVSAYGGVEEFVSYLIVYLIHQPNEDLRCASIRMLAFFALNVDQLSAQIAGMSTRKGKRNVKAGSDGMGRLHACGALALLCEVVSSHCLVSSNQTYRAMLDLLLLKHGPLFQSVPNYETLNTLRSFGDVHNPIIFDHDNMDDEDDIVNPWVLPIFLELLPRFPVTIHDQIYSDLLSMVKHSPAICSAFSACPSWHLCMFGMVLELINENEISSPTFKRVQVDDLVEELQQKAPSSVTSSPLLQHRSRSNTGSGTVPAKKSFSSAGGKLEIELLRRWKTNAPVNRSSTSLSIKYSNYVAASDVRNLSNVDMNFDVGMKIYSTLLVHALEKRGGWRQLDQSISPSFESQNGYLIAQSILSHLMNDLTFNLKSRHKELQKLLKSNSNQDQQTAYMRMENLLSTILTASQIALIDQNCVMSIIPYPDVCKQRVQVFYDMQQHIRSGSISVPVDGSNSARSIDSERFQSLSVIEQRKFLDDVEKMLQESFLGTYDPATSLSGYHSNSGLPASPRSPRPPLNEATNGETAADEQNVAAQPAVEEYLDLSHNWMDMNVLAVSSRFSMSMQTRGNERGNQENHMASFMDKPLEELLHPLERQHDEKSGKIILILQALRIFDTLFWPSLESEFQDSKMMLFSKEGSHFLKSAESNAKVGSTYMTIHSALMRMSLFALNNISPTNAINIVTLRRIRKGISCIDGLLPEASLAVDWMTATVTHVVLHMQRLALVLDPIFTMIGIHNHDFRLPTFGPWETVDENSDHLPWIEKEAISTALTNEDVLRVIEDYFDNSVGINLLRNIRSSLRILIDALHYHPLRLASVLEERCYRSLCTLIETVKTDLHTTITTLLGEDTEQSSSMNIPLSNKQSNRIISIDTNHCAGNVDGTSPSGSMSSTSPFALSNSNGPVGQSFSGEHDSPVPDAGHLGEFVDAIKPRSISMSASMALSMTSTNGRTASTTSAGSNLHKDPKSLPPLTAEQVEYLENNFEGQSIVLMLKWLLHPFFAKNILRSIEVIKTLEKLDNIEAKSVAKFSIETRILKDNLEEHRDVAIKSVSEMAELKSLSREVHDRLIDRSKSKRNQLDAQNLLKTKNVAACWHECIQRFEDDWSPWMATNPAEGGANTDGSRVEPKGVSYYELSKHRDCKLRNMLLTKLPEAIDHRDHAYLESKMKDQFSYLANQQQQDRVLSEGAAATASSTVSKVNLPVKFTPLAFATNQRNHQSQAQQSNNNWGDLEDEDDNTEEGGKTSTFTAGDLINPLGFFIAQEKRPAWTYMFSWAADERVLLIMDANQIQLDQVISGTILLSNKCLYFHCKKRLGGLARAAKPFVDRKYQHDRLFEAYGRRYLLQNSAVELFFADSPELFLAFKTSKELHRFFRVLKNQTLPLLTTPLYLNPAKLFRVSAYTEMWRRRMISNFEYLLRLNILAGRSYNDITQYPVFPWIIANYSAPTLDLNNPSTFRPLDKPIGAINPVRLKEFLERYRTFDDDQVPKFMYGSHYSSAGVVLHYMVRQEPFTTLAVNLQGGRFDCPDRIFFDINRTWQGCNNSMSDVKELIPELFCCPDILLNSSRIPLGELQEGGIVDDVILPPWAKDAFEFIRINREALESDYVSEHLHEWIDLIFGCKQKGPAAVKANNVFYYLTYENAIDIEAIDDHLQKEAAKAQVTHFGQTPSQLLNKEHPRRLPRSECILPLCYNISSVHELQLFTPAGSVKQAGRHQQFGAVIAMQCLGERLVVIHENLHVCYYRWIAALDIDGSPFILRPEKVKILPSTGLNYSEALLKGMHALDSNEVKSIAPFASESSVTTDTSVELRNSSLLRQSSQAIANESPPLVGIDSKSADVQEPSKNDEDDNYRTESKPEETLDEQREDDAPNESSSCSPVSAAVVLQHAADIAAQPSSVATSPLTSTASPVPTRPTSLLGRLSSFRFGSSNSNTAASAISSTDSIATSEEASFTSSANTTSSSTAGAPPPPPPPQGSLRRSTSLYGAAIAAGQSLSSTIRGQNNQQGQNHHSNMMAVEGASGSKSSTTQQKYFGKLVHARSASSQQFGAYVHPSGGHSSGGGAQHQNGHHHAIHRDGGVSAGTWTPLLTMTHHQVAIAPSGNRILTCGYWDHAVKMHALDALKEISSVSGGHRGVITTLEIGSDGQILLSGGMDGCLRVWVVDKPSLAQALAPEPFFSDYASTLGLESAGGSSTSGAAASAVGGGAGLLLSYNSDKNADKSTGGTLGMTTTTTASLAQSNAPLICLHTMPGHSSPITAVSYSADLDVVLSGDSEGVLCLHTVRQGHFVRTMKHMEGSSIDAVLAMTPGYLIAHSASTLRLSVTWVNGQVLNQVSVDDR
jgi:hypothetical protein